MNIDFAVGTRAAVAGFSAGERAALEQRLLQLADALGVGRQRSAVFDLGPHLVSCTFERGPQGLTVCRLRRLPPRRAASR